MTKFDRFNNSFPLARSCGTYISIREIEEQIGNQTAIPYTIPIRFRVSISLDDLLIFSAFTDYPNGLFGDLKIKFKINPHAFVFCQMNPIISIAKYYTMNKDKLLGSSQQKLIDIDLMFRNWSLTFQYTKQFTQLGCTADLITGLHAEPLTESGLKNLVCDIKPVTISIKNYVITEVTANMAGYKTTDACFNRIRKFYSQCQFVVPANLIFSKDAKATTCFENPCYQNIQIITCDRNFPDTQMNTHEQKFFQFQLNTSNLDLLFEATDEFEDALTTPTNTATRILIPNTDLTNFKQHFYNQKASVELRGEPIYQGATDSYHNVDTSGKKQPPPILGTIYDTFWLFSPDAGGSCICDTNYSFDEVIGPLSA
ncbi:MAG: hypothetical protein EZS28_011420 [Streblomastix strix]|uniref:Uncharacterized protein n=1 Tax=Streblomastix strix TaxID=222440 RepID=A0A5J4WEU7_9EUKA|nr:MAG: hypothetical protein EZS28_011420 [Streblomastix strix]